MSFNVLLLKRAQSDLKSIHSYLLKQSPQGAARWLNAFESVIAQLEKNPERYATAPENHLVSTNIQNASFRTRKGRPYRLVFTIVKHDVRVLRVLGPGQDWLRPEQLG
ncbi:MAG: type II toxin-antitoxin system RelE/ParE family toxin [Pirellulales bacterium]|jgi:plasmid stabilization system protein ParE